MATNKDRENPAFQTNYGTPLTDETIDLFKEIKAGKYKGGMDGRRFRALKSVGLLKGSKDKPQVTAKGAQT